MGENDPFSIDAFQEYFCKDRLVAKTHRAVQTLQYLFKATVWRWFSTKKVTHIKPACIKPMRAVYKYS